MSLINNKLYNYNSITKIKKYNLITNYLNNISLFISIKFSIFMQL